MARWRRRRAVQSRRRRDRHRAGRLRGLSGHPRRSRRASRRRHPAGGDLHGEVRHLRQHRRAACRWPTAPLSRPARPARIGRSCAPCRTCSVSALPFDSLSALRQQLYAEHPHFAALDSIAASDVAAGVKALAAIGGTSGPRGVRQPGAAISTSRTRSPVRPASWPSAPRSPAMSGSKRPSKRIGTWNSEIFSSASRSWWARACCCSSRCWSSSPTRCWPIARSGRRCSCVAARTWSGRGGCCNPSRTC